MNYREILFKLGFKDASESSWETYRKDYEEFELCLTRHKQSSPKEKFRAIGLDLEDKMMEVILQEDVVIEWVENFDKMFGELKIEYYEKQISY